MADVSYSVMFKQASGDVAVIVSRNSTTQVVDPTSGAPNRLVVPDMGNYNGNPERTVVSATAATPIVATLGSGHGIATGDWVRVQKGTGDLNINGCFLVTVATNDITLLGSATAGTYDANSATMRKLNKMKSYHMAIASMASAILNDRADIA